MVESSGVPLYAVKPEDFYHAMSSIQIGFHS